MKNFYDYDWNGVKFYKILKNIFFVVGEGGCLSIAYGNK